MKTEAAIIHERGGSLTIEQVDIRDPGPGEVRVRVEACGVCRSDLHAIDGGESVTFPAILGHEAAGAVEATGAGVDGLKEGDRVVLSWTPACGRCAACVRGEVQLCSGVRMSAGTDGPVRWNGGGVDRFMALGAFAGHVVVPAAMAISVTDRVPAHLACLIGCSAMTGFGAATRTAAVCWGESVAVIGCGGVGLAAVQGARIAGAARIFAIDPIEERRRTALAIGATDALDPSEAAGRVVQMTNGGADAAIECVGSPQTMSSAFSMVRPGGRAVVAGLAGFGDMVSIPAVMLLTERSIKGSIYGSANPAVDFPKLLELAEQGRLNLEALAGKVRPLAEVNEGIREMREGSAVRVVLTC